MIFFGQVVDHDVTLDASSTYDTVVDNPGEIANVRTPTLDLDANRNGSPREEWNTLGKLVTVAQP